MATTIVPISDLRRKAKDVIDVVQGQEDPVYITQHGRPVVVMVDYERFERLLEQLQELFAQQSQPETTQGQDQMLHEPAQQYAMAGLRAASLDRALTLARQLPPLEKARLVEQLVPELAQALQGAPPAPRKSLRGLWRGQDTTEQEIAEARREMWGDFPREDI